MDDNKENLVYDIIVSSTVPEKSTGEGRDREFSSMDLAMKLHYLKAVYFFESGSVKGLRLQDFKDPTFWWLRVFYMACGRVRRHPDTTRPFLKCNDGGIRCIEAQCSKTVAEWLAMDDHQSTNDHLLVHHQPLGPQLVFSPLVYLQITWFKCGGVSLGLSWAHILGDAFSAVAFANLYGQSLSGNQPEQLSLTAKVDTEKPKPLPPLPFAVKPMPAKRVGPVADHWAVPDSGRKMGTHFFHVTVTQLQHLLAQLMSHATEADHDGTESITFTPFEVLAALIWKSLAATSTSEGDRQPPLAVTICETDSHRRGNEVPRNSQRLRVVETPEEVEVEWWELARRIAAGKKDPGDGNGAIEEVVEKENGNVDLVVYGANLTFVNMEEAEVYGMEIRGHSPVRVSYSVGGVGENGVVLVLPSPPGDVGGGGRTVSVTLPEDQLVRLKFELFMRL